MQPKTWNEYQEAIKTVRMRWQRKGTPLIKEAERLRARGHALAARILVPITAADIESAACVLSAVAANCAPRGNGSGRGCGCGHNPTLLAEFWPDDSEESPAALYLASCASMRALHLYKMAGGWPTFTYTSKYDGKTYTKNVHPCDYEAVWAEASAALLAGEIPPGFCVVA